MRGLKFRVWCKRTQEYHTPIDEEDYDADGENIWLQMCIDTNGRLYFIETSDEDAGFEYVTHDCEIIDNEEAEGFIVEQYTGLKDKNGREIYEGDIIQEEIDFNSKMTDGVFTYVVEWDSDTLCYRLRGNSNSIHDELWEVNASVEVIGNIHENQDLLGDTNVTNKEEE